MCEFVFSQNLHIFFTQNSQNSGNFSAFTKSSHNIHTKFTFDSSHKIHKPAEPDRLTDYQDPQVCEDCVNLKHSRKLHIQK